MLFEFVDIAYSISIIFFIVGSTFLKPSFKQYFSNCIVVNNKLLILYSWYLLYKFYQLIQFIIGLNIKVENKINQPIEIGWFEIRFILLILFPYLFLFKKLAKNIWLSLLMLCILQSDILISIYRTTFQKLPSSSLIIYLPYMLSFKILNFSCLFIAVYALLWLLKKLPSQQPK